MLKPSAPDSGDQAYRFPNNATPPGSAAYYCIRFGTRQSRPELALLFAWRAEIRRIQEHTRDPGVARLKLDWWRREVEASRQGQARHPLAQALTTPMQLQQLPLQPFLQLLDAAETDVLAQPIAEDEELWAHCRQAGGAFAELLTRVAGGADRRAARAGSSTGWLYPADRDRHGARGRPKARALLSARGAAVPPSALRRAAECGRASCNPGAAACRAGSRRSPASTQ